MVTMMAHYVFQQVYGTRFTDKYLLARQTANRNAYSYSYTPHLPSRSTPTKPTSAISSLGGAPASPPRKVVTDFAAFGAPANASVFGTAVTATPFSLAGGKAAFGGIRNPAVKAPFDADDDEDEDADGRQKVELREDSISLDQVRDLCCGRLLTTDAVEWKGAPYRDAECLEGSPGMIDSFPRVSHCSFGH
jgi:hypothetical protein